VVRRLLRAVRRRLHPDVPHPPTLGLFEELFAAGPAPLVGSRRRDGPMQIAVVVPSFKPASGGHQTVANLCARLADRGHAVSIWIDDSERWHLDKSPAQVAREFAAAFSCGMVPVHVGFSDWQGAETAIATGWQTVPRVLLLPGVSRRTYLVQDHEPQFYPASLEAFLAELTYGLGLPCLAASEWLANLLRERYSAHAVGFELPVDHDLYRPQEIKRQRPAARPKVLFYARPSTPRRAVVLGLAALERVARVHPQVEIVLFGAKRLPRPPFRSTNLGVLSGPELADLYRSADLGVSFSLTNPSLVTLEMMACGLPTVDLASPPMVSTFGHQKAPLLCRPSAAEIADRIVGLLSDPEAYESLRKNCLAVASTHAWEPVIDQIERYLAEL